MEQSQTRLDPVDAMLRDMKSPRKQKDPVAARLAPPPARGPAPTASENVLGYINDIVMGATGGQSNKVNAAVNAAASKVGGLLTGEDVDFGEEYDKGMRHLYNRRKKHEKANPVSSGAATIAGALVPASKVAKVVDKFVGPGAGLGKKILAQGAAGMGEGAVAGHGYAEPGKEWDGATMGGALGALTGSVAPILGHAVKRIVEKYFMGAKSPAIPAAAKAYITRAARDQGMSVDQFIAKYKELGDGATAYDTGQPMTMLAKTLTKVADDPGDAAGKAVAIREARRADQGSLLRTIDDNIAEAGKDVSVPIERSPAWAKVKATSVKIDDNLVDIMDRPSFRKAYAKAQEKAREEGKRAGNEMPDLDALIKRVRVAEGAPGGGIAMSVGGLQKIKKALDKALEVDRDPFGKLTDNYDFEAMALRNNTRKEFVDWVKGKSPEYGKLLDADHKNFLLKDAREMGELFFSPKTQKGEKLAEIMGGILPYLFIIFSFMGSMYPAIDLAAGEKERGTLETLLTTPTRRMEILLGKFGVVMLTGLFSAIVSIAGMSLGVSLIDTASPLYETIVTILEVKTILLLLSLLLPLTVFFAALSLSLSLYARSFKEAQNIITPMMFVVIVPAFIGVMPGMELNSVTALIPILNVSLTTKAIIAAKTTPLLMAQVYGSLLVLAAFSLFICGKIFEREEVIFRGV